MTQSTRVPFTLQTNWIAASDGQALAYTLTLTNHSGKPIENFRLFVSGPARIDPAATIEGGKLVMRLSNHSGF
ncbi:MAG: beta-N-acetylhexosaminidase, partial [Mesorhizobium sp.]